MPRNCDKGVFPGNGKTRASWEWREKRGGMTDKDSRGYRMADPLFLMNAKNYLSFT